MVCDDDCDDDDDYRPPTRPEIPLKIYPVLKSP